MTDEELQRYLTMPVAEFPEISSSTPPEYSALLWEAYMDLISSILSKP